MAKRITAPGENTNAGQIQQPKTSVTASSDSLPTDYVNPFDDPEQMNKDGYPFVFSDIDFELKQAPHRFNGFNKMEINLNSQSKSENETIWQYLRWKTWMYLESQEKVSVVMQREGNEKDDARGTVQINAVTYYILKGVKVFVPADVEQMILTSQNQTDIAGQQSLATSLSHKLDPVTGLPKDPTRLER